MEPKMNGFNLLDIICYHVGGTGGYGPIDAVLKSPFGANAVVVVFEARDFSPDDLLVQEMYYDKGVRTILVPRCVSDKCGPETFYINKHVASSSMLQPAAKAKSKDPVYSHVRTWGENTELDRVIDVETITIDHLVQSSMAPNPDVLSIDAQGVEYRILQGGSNTIKNDVTCVVTEVEFSEVYEGQHLFCDQFCFLHSLDFMLVDILNSQFWHPAPAAGKGFLTVGEALFLRDYEPLFLAFEPYFSSEESIRTRALCKLMKLAAVSFCFQRLSYAYNIVDFILNYFGDDAERMLSNNESYRVLLELYRFMSSNLDKYMQDNKFYLKNIGGGFRGFAGKDLTRVERFLFRGYKALRRRVWG